MNKKHSDKSMVRALPDKIPIRARLDKSPVRLDPAQSRDLKRALIFWSKYGPCNFFKSPS